MTVKRPLVVNQPKIGKLIVELRVLTGLTQEQFAAHLGVTLSSISRWERGLSKPSPLAMQNLEGMLQQMGDRGQELLAKYSTEYLRSHRRQHK